MLQPIRYSAYLETLANEINTPRSGKRTRLKLLSAAAKLLDSANYSEIKVIDICKEAGCAKGTFFIYFATKEDLTDELLSSYIAFEKQAIPAFELSDNAYQDVKTFVEWYELNLSLNHGVISCLMQLGAQGRSYNKLWTQRNKNVVNKVMPTLESIYNGNDDKNQLIYIALRSIGTIMDQSLLSRYGVGAGADLDSNIDISVIIEIHSLLIFRAFFGTNPPPEELEYTQGLI